MIDEDVGTARRPRAILPWVLSAGLLMFAAGMLLSPWFEENVRSRLPGPLGQQNVGAVAARQERQAIELSALDARVVALEARPAALPIEEGPPALNDKFAVSDPASGVQAERAERLAARIDALERGQAQTGTRLDNLSAEVASLNIKIASIGSSAAASLQSAATSAQKARGVLLVTAARRAAEQGQSLAVLEPALRRQFGTDNTDAVEKLLAASQDAPTLDALRQKFARLRGTLADSSPEPAGANWWTRLKDSIADVVEVRRTTTAGIDTNANAARIAEMSRRLQRGDVSGALVILQRLPIPMQRTARDWRLDAEAYATTYGALQQLEAAVLLDETDMPVTVAPPKSKPADSL